MLWSKHLGRAAGMSRSSRARYQPRFETLENRLTPTTDLLPPMVGGEALNVPDLSAPAQMPVIAAETPSDSAEAPSDSGTVGAEEPPLIVGGEGTLPAEESQASATPPEDQTAEPPLPPVGQYELPTEPTLPPVGQFELPPVPPTIPTVPPDIVNWGADEVVPIQTPPVLPIPAVSIGEPASGFGELPPVVAAPSISTPVPPSVAGAIGTAPVAAPAASAGMNVWLSPTMATTPLLPVFYASAVDQVFSTPSPLVATTAKSSDAHADLFGVGADTRKEPAETDLLVPLNQIAKADSEHEEVQAEEAQAEAEAHAETEAVSREELVVA